MRRKQIKTVEIVERKRSTVSVNDDGTVAVKQEEKHVSNDDDTDDELCCPLEATPVLRAVIEYGRKMNALGELRAAKVMQKLATRIRSMELSYNAVTSLADDIDEHAAMMMSTFVNTYSE
jgi:hypothetical protein